MFKFDVVLNFGFKIGKFSWIFEVLFQKEPTFHVIKVDFITNVRYKNFGNYFRRILNSSEIHPAYARVSKSRFYQLTRWSCFVSTIFNHYF